MPNILKNSYLNTIYIWVAISIAAITIQHIFFLAAAIIYTGALPFINSVIWLSISSTGIKIRKKLKVFHWAAMFSIVVFLYGIYAQSWASSTLNQIFYVDANNFGITYTFISFLLAPVGLLYHDTVIGALYPIFIITSMFLVYIIPIALLTNMPFTKVLKISGVFFGSIFLMSFFLSMAFNLSNKIDDITKSFAVANDFNSNHLCQDSWSTGTESVIFLGGHNVLVYSTNKPLGSQFSKETCDFSKSF
jgi:hypothetical protein